MENRNLTIGDIAAELGVSKTTVSRAISGKGRIGEQTRKLVLDYIKEHNYRPNVVAQGLAQSKTFNLGLVIPGDYNIAELPFFQQCMLGISRTASARGYDILIIMVSAEDIGQLARAVANRKVDGVILSRTLTDDASVGYLMKNAVPFVTIGSTDEEGVVWIDNDHRNACRELTDNLLAHGIRKIALIGGDRDYVVNRNRLAGFEDAFAAREEVAYCKQIFQDVEDSRQVQRIVARLLTEQTECIIATDDFLCSCVLNYLQQRQVRIPEQIQVASFYDSTLLAGHIPSVTSIWFDAEKVGQEACGQLLRILDGEAVDMSLLLGYEVRMRRTAGVNIR